MANGCWQEVKSLLYWCMLAACTVGPGTVVTCARAGVEYELDLIWALVFASLLAYTLQESSARLTIVSGVTLGQCLRLRSAGNREGQSSWLCWSIAIAVYAGNMLYECNNWAGGIDAIFAFPGIAESGALAVVRVAGCVIYAVLVLLTFYLERVEALGLALGIVMMAMILLFLIVVCAMGLSWSGILHGLIPKVPPQPAEAAEPSDMILSLVGTTAIGFNLFLGGEMAKTRLLPEVQRGIAFSTLSAFIVSVMIMIIGSGARATYGTSSAFNISQLAAAIHEYLGDGGSFVFALGFVAAAFSSMLTVILGVTLAADSLLFDRNMMEVRTNLAGRLPKRMYWGVAVSMVVIPTLVVGGGLPRGAVILVAQVFNGILLPLFCLCLLICYNDSSPGICAKIRLYICVLVTFLLAWRVLLLKMCLVSGLQLSSQQAFILAACLAVLSMLTVSWRFFCRHDVGDPDCRDKAGIHDETSTSTDRTGSESEPADAA
eukprot:TRINITY_DN42248_c0_g1_i1.p1 TRINITY_DN42248_c0_g1~~TRINITY_DN42248_c0_g1_i1.p1  ORF type:complete len:489 (-),score=74.13 TRINITY_DN42248_c0_g1_i1:59-1525(-)